MPHCFTGQRLTKAEQPFRPWSRAQYCPFNAVEMTGIVLIEFTKPVNLRLFCTPQEVSTRPMPQTMLAFVFYDNPVKTQKPPAITPFLP
jgi:hypothetical protein